MTGWNLPPGVNARDIPGNEPEPTLAEIARDLYSALRDLYEHTEARCVTVGDCNAARRALDQAEDAI
jgi:hypothetical protein